MPPGTLPVLVQGRGGFRSFVAGAVAATFAVALVGCGSGRAPLERAAAPVTTTTAPSTTTTPVTTAPATTSPPAPLPRPDAPPTAARTPAALADQLLAAIRTIRNDGATDSEVAHAALVEQVALRALGVHPEWDADVLRRLPASLRDDVRRHVEARRQFRAMHSKLADTVPAWRIVEPAPAADLLRFYREAGARYDIAWEYLAAINLVETGMGRIRGTSIAGAQGPMQFMPATWAAFGKGDINDPRDAIMAAARYLAHNNGANDIAGALWNYNHSNRYVRGVMLYAAIMRDDPRSFRGFYNWGIFYLTTHGDIYLPVGYEERERVPVAEWLSRRGR